MEEKLKSKMGKIICVVLALFLAVSLVGSAFAVDKVSAEEDPALEDCSTIIVGKKASATGEVLLGHNEDNGDNVMVQYKVPAATHKLGELLTFEATCAKIPQVEQTWAYLWSETRASWSASFSDFFINEWGVAIVSNSMSPSREDKPELTDGGIGYGLRVLIAQRAKTAREGVELAVALLDQYGYAASGRAYSIVDKNEGWNLQAVKGKHYVAERIPDDQAMFLPNWYTIHQVDLKDTANFIASPDIITYAISRGWYTPAVAGSYSDFDFAVAYQSPTANQAGNIVRQKNGLMVLLGKAPTDVRAFSVKPLKLVDLDTIKGILRSHYEGTSDDLSNGYAINPHQTGVRTICSGTTMESVIIQFREQPEFTCVWRATLNPCTSPYVPWYLGITKVPTGYGWLTPANGMATHFNVPVGDLLYRPSRAWWAFQDVQDLANGSYADIIQTIVHSRDALEKRWITGQPVIEKAAYAMFKQDKVKAMQMLTDYTNKQADLAWSTWRTLFNTLLDGMS